jgi:uncharacterized protein (DUF2141 family)
MHRVLWRRVRGGTRGSRLFAAYTAIVMVVALVGPGLAVYAAEGETTDTPAPVVEEPAPEVPEAPAEEAEAVPPAEEPAAEPEPMAELLGEPVEAAAIVDPEIVENPTGPPDEGCERIDDPESMIYEIDGVEIEIVISYEEGVGYTFCFEVLTEGYAVSSVVAKGGPDANVYTYDPPVTADCGLNAPALESNGMFPALSHIDFCIEAVEAPETGDLEVCKFEDLDGDGVWDEDEMGLEGWEFTVYGADEEVVDSGMTGEDGCILFEDLDEGMVLVVETVQEGWTPTTDTEQEAEIIAGETAYLEFGNMMEEEDTGALLVHKFEDLDGDGEWDEDEPALEGWDFTVYDGEENELASGTTDEDGMVLFEDLPVGMVVAVETLMEGWTNTTDLEQEAEIVADATAHLYFGNMREVLPPEFGDVVVLKFRDVNGNGVADAGEAMLSGWEFKLYKDGVQVGSAVTNASGRVDFADLESGTYTVIETPKSGWTNTTPLSRTFVVVENQTVTLYFGNIEVEEPFAPFTPSAPFLPFTGGDMLLLLGAAAAAATGGSLLRRRAA